MISSFTPVGMQIVSLRTKYGVEAGRIYTVRGFVINRHHRTKRPDAHVLLNEVLHPVGWPKGKFGEIGFPRDGFDYPQTGNVAHREMAEA